MPLTSETLLRPSTPDPIRKLSRRLPGETPHADDLFFRGSTLAGTAYAITGTGTWTQDDDALMVVANGQSAADAVGRAYSLTASAPCTVETAIEILGSSEGIPHIGLAFTDGTAGSSNLFSVLYAWVASQGYYFYLGTLTDISSSFQTLDAGVDPPQHSGLLYVRAIWKSANTFTGQYSANGRVWTKFGASDQAKTMTPTGFGPVLTTWGGGEDLTVTYRYFRVTAADLSA